MKSYPSISGIKKEFKGLPCIAFDKYDGSCIRIEYSKKKGFYKFGTRRRLLDKTDKEFGMAIDLFLNKYGESIPKVLTDNKELKNAESVVFFAEFYGEDSFAGYHNYDKPFDIVLFDVAPYKIGLLPPRQFIRFFDKLHIPAIVYDGIIDDKFIDDIRNGLYPVKEGAVAKGLRPGTKPPHGIYMVKIKTLWWLAELKRKSEYIESLRSVLEENEREQS